MTDVQQNTSTPFTGKVLVTGGAGFIGSHVVEYLCAHDIEVRCFVKESSNLQYIQHLPIELFYGDICDIQGLNTAMKDITAVIHIAALSKDWGNYKDFYNVNVKGTLNALKACKTNNIENIIVTGSISSYGEENSKEVKTEEHPFNSHYSYFADSVFPCKMNYYRDSKALCTKEAISFSEKAKLNITIIEPVFVYGEREFNSGFYAYLKTIKSNIPFFIGSKRNKFQVVYARDLAHAYYSVLTRNLQGVNRFIIGNSEPEYMHKIFGLFCRQIDKKQPKNLPKALVYPFGFIVELLYTIFRSSSPPLLTRGRINMFYDNIEYSTEKAKNILSFHTEYSLEDGIKRTVDWYKENNLI